MGGKYILGRFLWVTKHILGVLILLKRLKDASQGCQIGTFAAKNTKSWLPGEAVGCEKNRAGCQLKLALFWLPAESVGCEQIYSGCQQMLALFWLPVNNLSTYFSFLAIKWMGFLIYICKLGAFRKWLFALQNSAGWHSYRLWQKKNNARNHHLVP